MTQTEIHPYITEKSNPLWYLILFSQNLLLKNPYLTTQFMRHARLSA